MICCVCVVKEKVVGGTKIMNENEFRSEWAECSDIHAVLYRLGDTEFVCRIFSGYDISDGKLTLYTANGIYDGMKFSDILRIADNNTDIISMLSQYMLDFYTPGKQISLHFI